MFYTEKSDAVVHHLDSDITHGLSLSEARKRQEKYGKNVFETKAGKNIFLLFLLQFQNGLVYILLLAVGITFFIGEYIDASIILGVVILNAIIGVIQEYKAERAINALKKMSSPHAIVVRDGKTEEIPSEEIVPGDIVVLDTGRTIPADIRLIEDANLTIDESILTGESVPEKKIADVIFPEKTPLADRENMAYMGTLVVVGRGKGIVVATGSQTEMGQIAKSLETDEQPPTPLEIRIEDLSRMIGKLVVIICVLLMVLAYFQGRNLEEMFLISVSLAVASIPEGLVAIITIVLSIGVTQMAKKNAIIRHLPAVETLGSVNIICSDKTGTLTQNQMTVTEFSVSPGKYTSVKEGKKNADEKLLAKAMVLASDATLENGESTGDPTEVALLQFADTLGDERHEYEKNTKRIRENPFDSERKCMSTLVQEGATYTIYAKGSLSRILDISTQVRIDGKDVPLTKTHRQKIIADMEHLSENALRVLAVATGNAEEDTKEEDMEKNLLFLGFVGMIDPPREEAKNAIEKAKNAGVDSIMITGDHAVTAFAIAKTLGIAESEEQVLTGKALDAILDSTRERKKFEKNILSYRVYARVSPRHKVTIVELLQARGYIVSMTGDGVNDAPSLNIADIGIAMGKTGTDVSKGASDMILADDNFATIVSAIEQGRNIYNNIKKSIIFLLTGNLGEVITMVVALSIGWESPLLATQLLWINLITDSLPAIALGMDTNDPKIMNTPPRNPKEGFFRRSTFGSIFFYGALIGGVTLIGYAIGMALAPDPTTALDHARSMAFITLITAQLLFAFSIRSHSVTSFGLGFFSNRSLTLSLILGIFLQVILFSTSFTREIFHLVPLRWEDWYIVGGLGLLPFLVNEGRKILVR